MASHKQVLPSKNTYSRIPKRLESLKRSASYIPSNLTVLWGDRNECCGYAVVRGGEVCVMRWEPGYPCRQIVVQPFNSAAEDGDIDSLTLLTGVKWCDLLSGQTVLIITSYAGFSIFDVEGHRRLFQYRMTVRPEETVPMCARGIACMGNSVCIGTSDGTILVFTISEEKGVEYRQQLGSSKGSSHPISCLAISDDGRLASGDESGRVIIWRDPSRTSDIMSQNTIGKDIPIVAVCWWKDVVIGGYGDGTVRVCSSRSGTVLVEIHAHSRWINSIDVAKDTGLILSVSEDSTVCVWRLSGIKQPVVTLLHSGVVADMMLCGGMFCDSVGSMFALTAYDCFDIMEYSQS